MTRYLVIRARTTMVSLYTKVLWECMLSMMYYFVNIEPLNITKLSRDAELYILSSEYHLGRAWPSSTLLKKIIYVTYPKTDHTFLPIAPCILCPFNWHCSINTKKELLIMAVILSILCLSIITTSNLTPFNHKYNNKFQCAKTFYSKKSCATMVNKWDL